MSDERGARQAVPWPGGLPTDPEVRKLMAAFPDIEKRKGTILRHEEIAEVIRIAHPDGRYKSVVAAWRVRLRKEKGIYLDGKRREVIGIGFAVLTASEQITSAVDDIQSAGRHVRRSWQKAAVAPDSELDEIGRKRRDHVGTQAGALLHAHLQTRRVIAEGPKRPESLPSRPTPEETREGAKPN